MQSSLLPDPNTNSSSLIHIREPQIRRPPKRDPPGRSVQLPLHQGHIDRAHAALGDPDAAWVAQQASSFKTMTGESGCRVLTRDRDTRFGKAFDGALRDTCVTPVRLPHCSPNLNAHAERFIVRRTGHLDCLTNEELEHHYIERPHHNRRLDNWLNYVLWRRWQQSRGTIANTATVPGAGIGA